MKKKDALLTAFLTLAREWLQFVIGFRWIFLKDIFHKVSSKHCNIVTTLQNRCKRVEWFRFRSCRILKRQKKHRERGRYSLCILAATHTPTMASCWRLQQQDITHLVIFAVIIIIIIINYSRPTLNLSRQRIWIWVRGTKGSTKSLCISVYNSTICQEHDIWKNIPHTLCSPEIHLVMKYTFFCEKFSEKLSQLKSRPTKQRPSCSVENMLHTRTLWPFFRCQFILYAAA